MSKKTTRPAHKTPLGHAWVTGGHDLLGYDVWWTGGRRFWFELHPAVQGTTRHEQTFSVSVPTSYLSRISDPSDAALAIGYYLEAQGQEFKETPYAKAAHRRCGCR
jgi:hypothetical protein